MRSLQPFIYLTALLMLICTSSFAQQVMAKSSKAAHMSFNNNLTATLDEGTALLQPDIKMQQTLLKQFPGATQVEWRQLGKNYYISFLNHNQKASTVLSPKGIVKYTVTNCTLKQLPEVLQNKIAKYYAGYAFVNAMQINAHDAVAHEVILENENDFLTLKATEEGIEATQTLRKTNAQ